MVIDSPVGHLLLAETDGALSQCRWTDDALNAANASPFLIKVVQQLDDYFQVKRQHFDIPLALDGTMFQQAVWRALREIPYGQTWSYQALAMQVGRPKAYRAAGSANGKNPICIIIPCHRVILASGQLGGFAGDLTYKKYLLALEQRHA